MNLSSRTAGEMVHAKLVVDPLVTMIVYNRIELAAAIRATCEAPGLTVIVWIRRTGTTTYRLRGDASPDVTCRDSVEWRRRRFDIMAKAAEHLPLELKR